MTYTVEYYQNLVTSEHQSSPNYMRWLSAMIEPLTVIQSVIDNLIANFDIDTASGKQLDIVGQWIGLSRVLNVQITGVYYSVNGTLSEGVDQGILKGVFDPDTGIVLLPDDIYRVFLKIKIGANHWDGSIPGAYAAFANVFSDNAYLIIIDNQDMSMSIGLVGLNIGSAGIQYLESNPFPFKPEGVRIKDYLIDPTGEPFYAVGIENEKFAGVNKGVLPVRITL